MRREDPYDTEGSIPVFDTHHSADCLGLFDQDYSPEDVFLTWLVNQRMSEGSHSNQTRIPLFTNLLSKEN